MIKELLEQADSVIEEIKDIENRLKNIEKREKTKKLSINWHYR